MTLNPRNLSNPDTTSSSTPAPPVCKELTTGRYHQHIASSCQYFSTSVVRKSLDTNLVLLPVMDVADKPCFSFDIITALQRTRRSFSALTQVNDIYLEGKLHMPWAMVFGLYLPFAKNITELIFIISHNITVLTELTNVTVVSYLRSLPRLF